jgi:uncharacterized coiled-coil protein SlyX
MNMRFHFKEPKSVKRHKPYKGKTLEEANKEISELREWIESLTEQLEYVIGKEENNGENRR